MRGAESCALQFTYDGAYGIRDVIGYIICNEFVSHFVLGSNKFAIQERARAHGPVDLRITSSVGTVHSLPLSRSEVEESASKASREISARGIRTVVNSGRVCLEKLMSSKPMIEMALGTCTSFC